MVTRNDPPVPDKDTVRREDAVLERIAAIVGRRKTPPGEVHVGDDAAVLAPFVGESIVSTDVAVWGVHLDSALYPLEDLGFKAVTAAVSDLAAMGARPRACVVAVTAPAGTDLEELHRGIADAASITDCPVVGGDLSSSPTVSVAVTVLGDAPGRGSVLRRGARPGDTLLVTGPLGRSAAGARRRRDGAPLDDPLVVAHRRPWPRVREGIAARHARASAMIDLSDGLALDAHRLASASGVGFELDEVPTAAGATDAEALGGGEDYELLIATGDPDRLFAIFASRGLATPLPIGRVVADVRRRTLRGRDLPPEGFQHEI